MPPPDLTLPLPEDDIEFKLAHKILGKDNPLDKEILLSLVGEPHRYSDLKPLLGDKRDHNLTMALDRLRDDGLVRKRSDLREDPPVDRWRLTELGKLVVFQMIRMGPVQDSIEAYLRGRPSNEEPGQAHG